MTRHLVATCASIVFGAVLVAAQGASPQTAPVTERPDPPIIKLTGCVAKGSAPNTFKFENAKINGKDANEPAHSYMLVPISKTYDFSRLVGYRVTITGSSDYKIALKLEPGQPLEEKDLPTFTARHVANASKGCS